ncbi:hypothetical protein COW80_02825 [Candidatus Beckwithbacteria bacterium CG22_combo_CG10-13_8_21_14_all_01_47_9]|uniref:DUF3800 domain-containing protein n=3 Tax=Candidatus Beckwithiibacteriota TaxID=1752726 RepID=A0A2H0E0N8_9BACT|nr:MAG: hypothetical protein COW80_02825 [Candidatus Beckwithbacteria bacterium CG22_combo_CG10-13_8_21_14_all_01_47_9]PJA22987.1 MAG: hypothetical protein COX59_01590 [Candidatus Beckwithbacteria bacterium CG_4_10_14_0_2_um_filter_47_25]PJC66187.1 MAG: hypothetical protein CO018_03215 [Candidatus Beckwithbacteria bacterium CG_4_9_14_0_2_um_filter_47_11]
MIVFIDEAGDPGFKLEKGSSHFFVMSLVIFDDFLEAEKASLAIKELRRKLKVNDRYEFKFNKTNNKFRHKFFRAILRFKFRTRVIVIDKTLIHSQSLRLNKEKFYNYAIMQLLKQSGSSIKNAKLKFDKRGERSLRKVFTDLKFVDSRQNTLVQLADMVAGAIYFRFSGKGNNYVSLLSMAGKVEDIWQFK